jgi:hypothetical protein
MQRNTSSFPATARVALALAACLPATAWSWSRAVDIAAEPTPIVQTVSNAAGEYWTGNGSSTPRVVQHYGSGDVSPAAIGTYDAAVSNFALKHVADNGDLIAVTDLGLVPQCRMVRYAITGVQRWSQTIACPGSAAGATRVWPAGADGSLWVWTGVQPERIGADGRVLQQLASGTIAGSIEAVDRRDGTLYALDVVTDQTTGEVRSTHLAAHDRQGTQRWRKSLDAPVRITVASDGTLRLAGIKDGLFVAALNADGTPRWSTIVDATATRAAYANLGAPLVDANGATHVALDGNAAGATVAAKLAENGEVRWRVRNDAVSPGADMLRSRSLAPNGDLVLTHGARISRIDADGRVRYAKSLARPNLPTTVDVVAFETDGASVLKLAEPGTGLKGSLTRLDIAGNALESPESGSVGGKAVARRAWFADGSIALWTSGANGGRELLRIGTNGGAIWRRSMTGVWTAANGRGTPPPGALVVAGDDVCTLDARTNGPALDYVLACHRSSDGSERWNQVVGNANATYGSRTQIHVAADGSVSAWVQAGPDVVYKLYRADGTLVSSTSYGTSTLYDVAPTNTAFALIGSGTAFKVVGAGGTDRYTFAPPHAEFTPAAATFGSDGSLVIAGADRSPQEGIVLRYAANGTKAWSRPFPATTYDLKPPAISGDAVYLATCCTTTGMTKNRHVHRLALADGATVWRRELPLRGEDWRSDDVALTPAGDALVVVASPGRTLDVDVLDTADGRLHATRRDGCRGDSCDAIAPMVAGRRVNTLASSAGGASLIDWTMPAAQNGYTRIDQPGIAGAWWSPYANGEGIVIDYLPASRTFFAPWFTFSREGGNDPAGLRWYVVQGAVPANATSVELPITESSGGNFDAGPAVQARIVGKATFTFTDCNNATMYYTFDAATNGAATGSITLTRLVPSTENCILADGTTQTNSSTPSNGFNAQQSGSWFEPATSGQGLQFVVQPGGVFFAPWFTFDPAGPSDDPGRQRWYTIQGHLGSATGGKVTAPIVQTIGGAFDRVPTNNMSIVGSTTITFTGCDRATLEYRFNDDELAGAMRARAGTADLVKIGGCSTR